MKTARPCRGSGRCYRNLRSRLTMKTLTTILLLALACGQAMATTDGADNNGVTVEMQGSAEAHYHKGYPMRVTHFRHCFNGGGSPLKGEIIIDFDSEMVSVGGKSKRILAITGPGRSVTGAPYQSEIKLEGGDFIRYS